MVMEVQSAVIIKTTTAAAECLLPLRKNGSDHQSTIIDILAVAGAANMTMVFLSSLHTSSGKIADIKGF